ncbi:MAG: S41 family peptidase [Fimbriimonadaceae bacterium]
MASALLAALVVASGVVHPQPESGLPALATEPSIRGNALAFVCEGDVWIADIAAGTAQRLTRHEGTESSPKLSPDGSRVAFTGEYDGAREVYAMPVRGGAPKRLTYRYEGSEVLGWSPDGAYVYFRSGQIPRPFQLYRVAASGGFPEKLPFEFLSHADAAPDGRRLVFTRFPRSGHAWFRYEGGMRNSIWVADLPSLRFQEVAAGEGSCEYPQWAGNRLLFAVDLGGKFAIQSVDERGRDRRTLVGPSDEEIRFLDTDGDWLVYNRGLAIERVRMSGGPPETIRLNLVSDRMHTRPFRVDAADFVQGSRIGPTGRRVLVVSRGQVLSLPVGEGAARVLLAKPGVRYSLAEWSPNGERLAFVSDESGEQQLYVARADGSEPLAVTDGRDRQLIDLRWSRDGRWIALTDSTTQTWIVDPAGIVPPRAIGRRMWFRGPDFDFSPDGRWVVVAQMDTVRRMETLILHEIATGRRIPLGPSMTSDFSPRFSADGQWLAFASVRRVVSSRDRLLNNFSTSFPVRICLLPLREDVPSPFAIEDPTESGRPERAGDAPSDGSIQVEGLYDRLIELPLPPGDYGNPHVLGDRVVFQNGPNVSAYDLKTKSLATITAGSRFEVSADGKKLLISGGSPANLRVVDADGTNVPAESGRVSFGALTLAIDPVAEWRQIYWEAWRLTRDYFYVANLHGANWKAIGDKYAAYLPQVRSRDEVDQLIRWTQAELAISHSFLTPGATRSLHRNVPGAFLGIDVQPHASGYYQIARVLRGEGMRPGEHSPLAAHGSRVADGEFLISVAGVPARVGADFMAGIAGRAGEIVEVEVNSKPSPEGARKVFVRPVPSEVRMRVVDWMLRNREYVSRASQGRIGYVFMRAMMPPDFDDFVRQYFPQRNREGLIVDVRFNSGGLISDSVARILAQRPLMLWNQRELEGYWTRQWDHFPGPMVCLMNEFSYSNGEEFPWQFREMKLGPVIGRRSRGGEVGSDPGWPLVDGGVISVPNYGAWTPEDGWIIEGPGVQPDIDVPSDPNAFARGRDPQLDAAVAHLLRELARRPVVRPTVPPDPVRARPVRP